MPLQSNSKLLPYIVKSLSLIYLYAIVNSLSIISKNFTYLFGAGTAICFVAFVLTLDTWYHFLDFNNFN